MSEAQTVHDVSSAMLGIYLDTVKDDTLGQNFLQTYVSFDSDDDKAAYCSLRLKKDAQVDISIKDLIKDAKKLLEETNRKNKEKFFEDGIKKTEAAAKISSFKESMKGVAQQLHPNIQAAMLWDENPYFYDRARIFWAWNKELKKYEIIDDTDIMIAFDQYIAQDGLNTNSTGLKAQILEAVKKFGRQKIPKDIENNKIQFKDKIVDILTGEMTEATSEYFCSNPIPQDIGETEDTPNMDRIFKEWVGEKYVKTLYEIIAYCCLTDYPIHRLFCLVGAGLNGKSKYQELICRFVGLYNVCSTELDLITKSRFELFKLYKKLVCQIGETEFHELSNTGMIKKLTGQDVVGFEKKGKDGFDAYNYAKVIINSNQLPTTTDKTIGFYRRWVIIDFPNQFTEAKDILAEIPDIEYSNLAKKIIGILKELLENRQFTNEGTVEERQQKYEDKSNPLEKFMKDSIVDDPDGYIAKWEFRDKFQAWCKQNGYRSWNETELSTELKKKYEDKRKGENRHWSWIGVSWLHEGSVKGVKGVKGSLLDSLYKKTSEKGLTPLARVDTSDDKLILAVKGLNHNGKGADQQTVSDRLKDEGIEDPDTLIQKMLAEGMIYQPEPGKLGVM